MKWLIVEDALRDRKGHWMEYVSIFVRELRALGDEVMVLCDKKAQGFVMEQTGARPVLPESIWHRMGDGAGALKRYLRVPGHAVATFVAMRKVFRGFNHGGHREHGVGVDMQGEAQGNAQGTCAGAEFSNPTTSEFARDSENTSLSRCASGPASALDAGRWMLGSGEAPDWIFVPTVLVHHLLGWWILLKTRSVPRESGVLLFFPNLPIRLDDNAHPHWVGGPTTRLMVWLFARLRGDVESGKLVLGVETHAMRRVLEGLIRMPVVYLPHPVPAKSGRGESSVSSPATSYWTLDTEASAKPIVFGCYGAARWEKGSDVFLKAIRLILQKAEKLKSLAPRNSTLDSSLAAPAAGRPFRFCIQWVEDFRDEEGNLVSIDAWLKNHPQVEVIGRYFQGDEYGQQLERTDVMVLPYRSPYRLRVSRVVIEAMLSGMPVIATEGTTLFEQAHEYGGVVGCAEGDAQSLADSILEVAERFESLRASVEEKVNAAAESFSVGFFRELLARNGQKLSTLDAGPSSVFSK